MRVHLVPNVCKCKHITPVVVIYAIYSAKRSPNLPLIKIVCVCVCVVEATIRGDQSSNLISGLYVYMYIMYVYMYMCTHGVPTVL